MEPRFKTRFYHVEQVQQGWFCISPFLMVIYPWPCAQGFITKLLLWTRVCLLIRNIRRTHLPPPSLRHYFTFNNHAPFSECYDPERLPTKWIKALLLPFWFSCTNKLLGSQDFQTQHHLEFPLIIHSPSLGSGVWNCVVFVKSYALIPYALGITPCLKIEIFISASRRRTLSPYPIANICHNKTHSKFHTQ